MKSKTKRKLSKWILFGLIAIFVAGTVLLYLPIGSSNTQNNPPPLNSLPQSQQGAPLQNGSQPAPGPAAGPVGGPLQQPATQNGAQPNQP